MSDTDTDPIIAHLQARRAVLERDLTSITARLQEIELLLDQLSDGRSRVRRRLREVPAPEAPPEQVA